MSEVRIAAESRTEFGKGGARRTRRAGKVPAVLYGHGLPPRHIALPAREFGHALKSDAGANVLLRLDLVGGTELALPKAIQRNPVRGDVEHVDLIVVRQGETVTVEVPVNLVGDPPRDALLDHQLTTLSVQAEATHIPQAIDVSIDRMRVGDSITAGAVILPPGATLQTDPETVVVHVLAQLSAAQIDAELAEAEAELGAGPTAAPRPAEEPPAVDTDSGGGDSAPTEG